MFGNGINNLYPIYKQSSLLSAIKNINFSNILNGTQKTLNIVNQTIPLVNQVKPIVNNAKTVFKIMGAFNENNNKNNTNKKNSNFQNNNSNYDIPIKKELYSAPQFFI